MKKYIVSIFGLTLAVWQTNLARAQSDILGFWQSGYAMVASGFNDHFIFSEDGSFEFNYNEMACDSRDVGFKGTFKITGNQLVLHVTSFTTLEGGYMESSMGSCATDSTLTDAVLVTTPTDETISLQYDGVQYEPAEPGSVEGEDAADYVYPYIVLDDTIFYMLGGPIRKDE